MRHLSIPLLFLPVAAAAQEMPAADHARAFLIGDTGPLWQAMTPALQATFGSEAALEAFRAGLPEQAGEEGAQVSEFVFLGHLRQGSIVVAEGDEVAAGDPVGRCGNSGNSSEPHLHVHLQTTPDLADGEGLPAQFSGYVADGALVERGEPLRGQVIAPAP